MADMQDVLLGVEAGRRIGWARYYGEKADHESAQVLIERLQNEVMRLRTTNQSLRRLMQAGHAECVPRRKYERLKGRKG